MASILFFIPKFKFLKGLTKISVYDILTNNFKVNLSKKLKPKYCVPVKKYFEEICFYYNISNDNEKTIVNRKNGWCNHFIFVYLLLNLLRVIIYLIWMEEDQVIRMYGGNIEVFFGFNTKYMIIPQVGTTLTACFRCLC